MLILWFYIESLDTTFLSCMLCKAEATPARDVLCVSQREIYVQSVQGLHIIDTIFHVRERKVAGDLCWGSIFTSIATDSCCFAQASEGTVSLTPPFFTPPPLWDSSLYAKI